jgi:hypothetical protein
MCVEGVLAILSAVDSRGCCSGDVAAAVVLSSQTCCMLVWLQFVSGNVDEGTRCWGRQRVLLLGFVDCLLVCCSLSQQCSCESEQLLVTLAPAGSCPAGSCPAGSCPKDDSSWVTMLLPGARKAWLASCRITAGRSSPVSCLGACAA